MTTVTITEAKAHLPEIVRNTDKRLERYTITQKGTPKAIIMSVDEFEGWLETLEILSDKKALKEIKQAKEEVRQGKSYSFEEVVGRPQRK